MSQLRQRLADWMARPPAWLVLLLLINALDLTTSYINPNNRQVIERAPWETLLQLALVIPLALMAARRAGPIYAAFRRLAVPAPAKAALTVVFAVQLVHVALKLENFPFTNVGMFTYIPPTWTGSAPLRYLYLEEEDGQLIPWGVRRAGDPFFHEEVSYDYKLALIYVKFRNSAEVYQTMIDERAALGLPPPIVHARLSFEAERVNVLETDWVQPIRLGGPKRPVE